MEYLFVIFVVVLFSYLASKLFEFMKIPKVLGPVLIGIYFASRKGILYEYIDIIQLFAELGLIFVLFHLGLEFDLRNFKKLEKETFQFALITLFFPLLFGILFSYYILNFNLIVSFIIGICLGVTAELIMSSVLDEEHMLKKKLGRIILGSEIINNLIGILIIVFISFLVGFKSFHEINLAYLFIGIITIILIISTIVVFYENISKALGNLLFNEKRNSFYDELTLSILILFFLAGFFYFIGLDYSIGAVFAGVIVNYSLIKFGKKGIREEHNLDKIVKALSLGFFGYFFFFWIGFNLDIHLFLENPWLGLIFALIGFGAKLFGSLFCVYLNREKMRTGFLVGIALSTKGIMGLVIAGIAMHMNLINTEIFNAIVFMSIILTIIPPIIFNLYIKFGDKV